jgi:hypothetical protein
MVMADVKTRIPSLKSLLKSKPWLARKSIDEL